MKNITDDTVRAAAQRASEGPADRDGGESADRLAGALTARPGTRLLGPPTDDAGGGGLPAAAVSTNVGGMGSHWTCACPRPGAAERIPFIPGEELDEALARAEGLLGVSPDPFADAPFAGEVRERLSRALDAGRDEDRRVQGMPLAVSRRTDGSLVWSGTDVILGDAADDSRVEITDLAQCRSVVTEDGRAVGVVVRDLTTGREGRVGARAVVVAGDALRTPQILFASGIRPWALGRYLNDQPQVVHAVRLPDEMTSGEGEALERTRQHDGAIVPQSGVSWVPYTDEHPFHGQVMQLDASPVPLAGDTPGAPGSMVGLGWFCAKELRPEDRVEFSETDTDAFGCRPPASATG